jgi:hypothetical protein
MSEAAKREAISSSANIVPRAATIRMGTKSFLFCRCGTFTGNRIRRTSLKMCKKRTLFVKKANDWSGTRPCCLVLPTGEQGHWKSRLKGTGLAWQLCSLSLTEGSAHADISSGRIGCKSHDEVAPIGITVAHKLTSSTSDAEVPPRR